MRINKPFKKIPDFLLSVVREYFAFVGMCITLSFSEQEQIRLSSVIVGVLLLPILTVVFVYVFICVKITSFLNEQG